MSTKLVVFFTLLCLTQVFGAPQPLVDWQQLGRNALQLGKKALPAGCKLLNGQPKQQFPVYYAHPYPYYQYPQQQQYLPNNVPPFQYSPPSVRNN